MKLMLAVLFSLLMTLLAIEGGKLVNLEQNHLLATYDHEIDIKSMEKTDFNQRMTVFGSVKTI